MTTKPTVKNSKKAKAKKAKALDPIAKARLAVATATAFLIDAVMVGSGRRIPEAKAALATAAAELEYELVEAAYSRGYCDGQSECGDHGRPHEYYS